MCKETRLLRKETKFWKRQAENFTRRRSRAEWRNFKNLFEKGYTRYVEKNLSDLIADFESKIVDATMNLQEGTEFFAITNCKFISKEIRDRLCILVYPDFIKRLIVDIQKGKVDTLSLEEGIGLIRIVKCNLIEESLRIQLRDIIYPNFTNSLVDDIQTGIINADDIPLGYLDDIQDLIDNEDVNAKLRSKLSTLIYGADERNARM